MNTLRIFINKISTLTGYISGYCILIMGIILFFEVLVRYVFNSPTIWTAEIATYLFMWAMFSGLAYTLKNGKHVRIDILIELLPDRIVQFMDLITCTVGLAFSGLVTFQAFDIFMNTLKYGKLSPTPLQVPLWIPTLGLVTGFLILTAQFLVMLLEKTPFFLIIREIPDSKEVDPPC